MDAIQGFMFFRSLAVSLSRKVPAGLESTRAGKYFHREHHSRYTGNKHLHVSRVIVVSTYIIVKKIDLNI